MSLSASKSCVIWLITVLCVILASQLIYHNKAITAESSLKAELEVNRDMIGRYQIVKVNDHSNVTYVIIARLDTITGKVCLMSIESGCIILKE